MLVSWEDAAREYSYSTYDSYDRVTRSGRYNHGNEAEQQMMDMKADEDNSNDEYDLRSPLTSYTFGRCIFDEGMFISTINKQ